MTGSRPVAAVIVNFRTPEFTAAAARSALAEGASAVVVVDNASGDGSVAHLRRELADPRVQVVANDRNAGYGAGVNLGMAAAPELPWVLVINSDAELVPGSLAALVDEIEGHPGVAAVAPLVREADGGLQADAYGRFYSLWTLLTRANRRPADVDEPDWISGVAMLFRRRAFDQVGGFDPAFTMYLEDVDLCRRLRAAGWRVRRCRQAAVVHQVGASFDASGGPGRRDAWYHQSLLLTLERAGASRLTVSMVGTLHALWRRVAPTARRLRRPGPRPRG